MDEALARAERNRSVLIEQTSANLRADPGLDAVDSARFAGCFTNIVLINIPRYIRA